MVSFTLALAFLFIIATDVVNGLSEQETIHAQNFRNDTHLIIESELEGKIHIHVGNYDSLHVRVNKSAQLQSDLEDIRVEINQNNADQFNLRVYIKPPTNTDTTDITTDSTATPSAASAPLISSSTLVTFLVLLAAGFQIVLQPRFAVFLLLVIFCLPICMLVKSQDMPRADIDIYIPKNQALEFVSLKSANGAIKVAEKLFTEAHYETTKLECLSGQLHQECPSCCSGRGDCINGECQCIPSFNGTECEIQNSPSFKLFVNPSDSRIMAAFTPEGDEIVAYGNKSEAGTPETVSSFRVIDDEGTETFADLDDDGRMEKAKDSNGNEMDFTWENDTMLFVSVVVANGTEQFTLHINLSSLDDASSNPPSEVEKRSTSFSTGPVRSATVRNNPNINEQLPYSSATVKNPTKTNKVSKVMVMKRNTNPEDETSIIVSVDACDEQLDDASVTVDVYNEYEQSTGQYSSLETYTASSTSTAGQYRAIIPSAPVDESTVETCDTIVTVIESACSFYTNIKKVTDKVGKAEKYLCGAIATAAFAVTKVPASWYSVYKFCNNAFKGISTFCDALGTATLGDGIGDKDFSEQICESVTELVDNFIDYFSSNFVLLTPKALIQGNNVVGSSKVVDLEKGSTTHLAITYEFSTPQILDYYSSPYDPAPLQDYVATVYFTCYSSEAVVFMSILGTDTYYDSKFCYGGPICQLLVPGAEALVQDTITVTITDPPDSPYTIQRVIYIVF